MRKLIFIYILSALFSSTNYAQDKKGSVAKKPGSKVVQAKKVPSGGNVKTSDPKKQSPKITSKQDIPKNQLAKHVPQAKTDVVRQPAKTSQAANTKQLAIPPKEFVEKVPKKDTNLKDNEESSKVQGGDTTEKKIDSPLLNKSGKESNPAENVSEPMNQSNSLFSIFIYTLLIALAGCTGYLYYRNDRNLKRIRRLKADLESNERTSSYTIQNFQSEAIKTKNELEVARGTINSLNEQLKKERKIRANAEVLTASPVSTVPERAGMTPPPPVPKENPVKYARYADQGDAFSISELLTEEDNDTIFEITTLSSSTAKFIICNNLNAQVYALSNAAYFLGKTCKYDSIPKNNSIIQTDIPGELKLQGNKWVIITPAKISFS